jgi:hypothetical protein
MRFTDLPPDARDREVAGINVRWAQLNELVMEASEQAIKYLFLTNSGGAIAVLSFIGSSSNVRALWAPRIALALFSTGVVLAGVLLALRLHEIEWLDKSYRADATKYLEGNLERSTLYSNDTARTEARLFKVNYLVGYISFLCFVSGGIVGLCNILSV